jgi:hypothetical protein
MEWYPVKLTAHIQSYESYAFGGRMIPDVLGHMGLPNGMVAKTRE